MKESKFKSTSIDNNEFRSKTVTLIIGWERPTLVIIHVEISM